MREPLAPRWSLRYNDTLYPFSLERLFYTAMRAPIAAPLYIFLAFAREEIAPYVELPRLHEEARLLRHILESADHAAHWVVVERQNVTWDDILEVFDDGRHRGRIAVFHFAGHSEGEMLLMQDRAGRALQVGAAALAEYLAVQPNLRLVFLNACNTQAQAAKLVSANNRAALTIKDEIDDEWASRFAVHFYRALAGGASVGEAYVQAQSAVQGEGYNNPRRPEPEQWNCATTDPQAMDWCLLPASPFIPLEVLSFLEDLKFMLAQRDFSVEDQAVVLRRFENAAHESLSANENIDTVEGDCSMADDPLETTPMAPRRLRKTADKLAQHMVAVAKTKDVWPDLLIGDDLVDTSIDSLNRIRLEAKHAATVLDQELPNEYQRRHRREYNGLVSSADSLASLFTELSSCMASDPHRPRTVEEMRRQLNELSYYTSRYIVWLEMVATLKANNERASH
ncbi:MAG: CHAT domain-containing protein [Caldilineaceae bacterium]